MDEENGEWTLSELSEAAGNLLEALPDNSTKETDLMILAIATRVVTRAADKEMLGIK